MRIADAERDKYGRMYGLPSYHVNSPGTRWIPTFLSLVGTERGSLIDLGCGTGRAGAQLAEKGFDVTLADITREGLEHPELPFHEINLWREIPGRYRFGYSCDVMEHLPEALTMLAIDRMLGACDRLFLAIANDPEPFGNLIGEDLHLTIRPFVWWRDHLRELGTVLDARDCIATPDRLSTSVFWVTRGH